MDRILVRRVIQLKPKLLVFTLGYTISWSNSSKYHAESFVKRFIRIIHQPTILQTNAFNMSENDSSLYMTPDRLPLYSDRYISV